MNTSPWPLFDTGRAMATPGALRALEAAGASALDYIARHARGDWGELDREDAEANRRAVEMGTRILSAYVVPGGTRIWIITEADRSATTVLLPDEY